MRSSTLVARRPKGLTLDRLYVLVVLALVALRVLVVPISPHDFWWHMAVGRQIVESGAIPQADTFSFTRLGAPFFNQSWLAQVLFYGLHQLGGLALIIVFQAATIVLAYALLLYLAQRASGRLRLSVLALLVGVVPISFDNWLVRPQSYALPLFAATLLVVMGYRLRWWRRLWPLPLLMLLWVNIHGSFVLGLGLIGLTALGEGVRRARGVEEALSWAELRTLALWGVLTGLATLVNPAGLGVIGYVSNLLGSSQVTTLVTEWASPSLARPMDRLFFIYLVALALALLWSRRWPPLTDLLLLSAFLWLSLSAVRNIMWFGMVSLTPLVQALGARLRPPRPGLPGSRAMNALVAGLVGLLVLLALPWLKPALGLPPPFDGLLDSEMTPVAAVEALQALPAGERPQRLYHPESFGSYLIWAAPEQPVFIDPRIELYPYEQWADSIALSAGRDAEALLGRYAIDGMLLSQKVQPALVEWARAAPGWRLAYEDAAAALFVAAR